MRKKLISLNEFYLNFFYFSLIEYFKNSKTSFRTIKLLKYVTRDVFYELIKRIMLK